MSDRLAIASAFSVLAMTAFVLFGANVERVPLAGEKMHAPIEFSAGLELPALSDVFRITR